MTTTIGPNSRIDGRIEGDDDVVVQGRVEGTVVLSDSLTILDGGYVSGDIDVSVLVVEGALSGTVRASQLVHLCSTAQVSAEIYAAAVRMDAGASLQGRVEMDVEAAPPAPARVERPAQKPRRQPAAKSEPVTRATPAARETATAVEVEAPAPREQRPERAPQPEARTRAEAPARAAAPAPVARTTTTTTVDPDEMTVKELRDMLKAHDLPVSGTKQDLIDRLREIT